ncbi:MAG: family 16 glycosylhydrolase [Bacteroidales bacterium]|nr:family 16 glycosylhydrolase [Bacteroidota bacterium]MBL6950561.1 family 16 glycosylhydrolase [Bacteroidales bacterium]
MSPSAYFSNSLENVKVESGKLKLKIVERDPFVCTYYNNQTPVTKTYYYSGGWVATQNPIHYGYIEMKCYLPADIALYPCFWMYGTIWPYQMTDYDEIDVFEKSLYIPSNSMLMQNFYHDTGLPTWNKLCQTLEFNQSYVGQENIFAVEWLPEEIHFYINGNLTSSIKYTTNSCYYNYPNPDNSYYTCTEFKYATPQKFQISLSLNLEANPNPLLTQGFEIDYIRSYKLTEGYNYEFWPASFSMSNPDMFKVHKSVRLGGPGHSAIIPPGVNITLWGKEGIILDQGFTLSPGTDFTARTIKTDPDLFQ